jgi:hypothetical protein
VIGLEASKREAKKLTNTALAALKPFGKRGETLEAIADYLLAREY